MRLLTPCFFLLAGLLHGQSDFTRYYDYGGNDFFRTVIQLSDSLLIATGDSRVDGAPPRAIVAVLDTAGQPRRSLTIDYPLRTMGMALARQTDSTFWLGTWRTPASISDDWLVYRVNALTGAAEGFGWGRVEVDEQIRAMAPTPEGGVVVVGNSGDINAAIFSRIDAAGNELFRREFSIPGNRFTVATDVKVLPGGDIIIVGQFDPNDGAGGLDAGFFLVRLTGAGDLVWSRRYDPLEGWNVAGNVRMVTLPEGGFAVTGTQKINNANDVFLAYVNSGGDLQNTLVTGAFFFTASDLVISRSGELVIAGNTILDEELLRGMALRFSPGATEYIYEDFVGYGFATRLRGIIQRRDNGFYICGSGACQNDALVLSLSASLQDTVASCILSQQTSNWEPGEYTRTNAGDLIARNDPGFIAPPLDLISASSRQEFCARFLLIPADLPDPICYNQPIRLLDTARQISPVGSIVRMLIVLGGDAGAEEGLEISDVPDNVTISGNGTNRILLELAGEETSPTLTTLLSRIEYFNAGTIAETTTRTLSVLVRSNCSNGESQQAFTFTVAPTNFNFPPLPPDTLLCAGQTLSLCAPEQPELTYAWTTGDTTACTLITQPEDYTLIRTSACTTDTSTISVAASEASLLLPEQTTEILCLGDSLSVTPLLPTGVTADWTDSFPDLVRTITTAGIYSLQRANVCGSARSTFDVRTTDCCQLYLPTAFSPNGDGINDRFRAFPGADHCSLITDYQLSVYNRWGGLVYFGTSLVDGWDGVANEKPAETGYYVYALSYFNGLEVIEKSGGFTLVR